MWKPSALWLVLPHERSHLVRPGRARRGWWLASTLGTSRPAEQGVLEGLDRSESAPVWVHSPVRSGGYPRMGVSNAGDGLDRVATPPNGLLSSTRKGSARANLRDRATGALPGGLANGTSPRGCAWRARIRRFDAVDQTTSPSAASSLRCTIDAHPEVPVARQTQTRKCPFRRRTDVARGWRFDTR